MTVCSQNLGGHGPPGYVYVFIAERANFIGQNRRQLQV